MSGERFWIWVLLCVAGWFVAVWLMAAWNSTDDDLAPYRFPYRDDDQ
jgi:hypothetical protein